MKLQEKQLRKIVREEIRNMTERARPKWGHDIDVNLDDLDDAVEILDKKGVSPDDVWQDFAMGYLAFRDKKDRDEAQKILSKTKVRTY